MIPAKLSLYSYFEKFLQILIKQVKNQVEQLVSRKRFETSTSGTKVTITTASVNVFSLYPSK
jgi:hypothetical protein